MLRRQTKWLRKGKTRQKNRLPNFFDSLLPHIVFIYHPKLAIVAKKIDWVIVGGESGHTPRPMDAEWVLDIQEQCKKMDVAFFFKQWGGKNKKASGRLLNGKTYDEMPEILLQKSV